MKFQDSSFNGLKVTVGTKSVTHARTHARSKSNIGERTGLMVRASASGSGDPGCFLEQETFTPQNYW